MAYWRDEADRRKQRKNGKQGAGRVDFPDRMFPVELTGSGKEVQVKVSGKVSVWGRQNLIFETGIRQKIIRPVTFVRKDDSIPVIKRRFCV